LTPIPLLESVRGGGVVALFRMLTSLCIPCRALRSSGAFQTGGHGSVIQVLLIANVKSPKCVPPAQ